MLTIPDGIKTLLKSKVMVGNNRPTAIVEVAGIPGKIDNPTDWATWRTFVGSGKGSGNMCETLDERAIIIYVESGAVKIAYADNVAGILDGTLSFDTANAVTLVSGLSYAIASINLVDDKLNVAIAYLSANPKYRKADFWRDTDGNGTGFALVSEITADLGSSSSYDNFSAFVPLLGASLIQKHGDGNLICILPFIYSIKQAVKAFYSTDNGATWTAGANITVATSSHLAESSSQTFLFVDSSTFWSIHLASSGYTAFCYWENSGSLVTQYSWNAAWNNWYSCMAQVGEKTYLVNRGKAGNYLNIYEYVAEDYTPANILNGDNWSKIHEMTYAGGASFLLQTKNALVCQVGQYTGSISGAGTVVGKVTLPVKSVTVDRSKGSASMATILLDNKNGQYSPDSTGAWRKIIWLNKRITIKLGYGAEQQLVFTGLIDEIMETNYPSELTIVARDLAKRALDQQPQDTVDGATVYALLYESKTPEEIFAELALMAGWAAEDIHVEISGVTVASIQFGHESFADCFQRLCELVAWEWFCDETGDIYFRAATEPEASAVYEFVEGTDIFSISYRISDAELYRHIVVWVSDEDGLAVKAISNWSAADYNNLLPLRTLIINAADLTTTAAGCQAIADAEANAITPKVREVNFVAVGHPYLQIGDVIKVTESTTHASELYRILEISHQMDAEGSPVFATALRCYHYGPA